MVLRTILTLTIAAALLAAALAVIDTYAHLPLADFLVKKLCDISLMGVTAICGLVAGKGLSSQKRQ
jgi:hypothetical protein